MRLSNHHYKKLVATVLIYILFILMDDDGSSSLDEQSYFRRQLATDYKDELLKNAGYKFNKGELMVTSFLNQIYPSHSLWLSTLLFFAHELYGMAIMYQTRIHIRQRRQRLVIFLMFKKLSSATNLNEQLSSLTRWNPRHHTMDVSSHLYSLQMLIMPIHHSMHHHYMRSTPTMLS